MLLKIKGYVNISKKANYLIVGQDALKIYKKKMYLILTGKNSSEQIQKIAQFLKEKKQVEHIHLHGISVEELTGYENCQIVGIKNKGIADIIIKILT